MDKRWISLCKVNRPDKNKDIWMQRLADSIDGTLVAPVFDEAREQIFDNRPLIFMITAPTILIISVSGNGRNDKAKPVVG